MFALVLAAASFAGCASAPRASQPQPTAAPTIQVAPLTAAPASYGDWRNQRIASLAVMSRNDPRLAPGIREVAERAVRERRDLPRTSVEQRRLVQAEITTVELDVERYAGRGRAWTNSAAGPTQPPRPVQTYQSGCTPTNPCVGPRGGLYYITASGNRVYLSRRR
ncbi:hypothetical protein GCM10011320_39550 [Neoroseomonas lacus]|uniref:Lipoprotein n=1 Tax=Neoroseomonas lacus TaxID=287609 RepID=A0A917KUF7_9PROT|nr:hypothetical protein GCM10011320_39550 [Neoroseomonas lacus]